jgi:hypothetical protein
MFGSSIKHDNINAFYNIIANNFSIFTNWTYMQTYIS